MSSKTVRYKCPFCEKRLTREDLIIHINDEHEDMLPENYSATRYVFNYVNKKPVDYCGKCTECGSPTKWREDVARYARQCDRPACKESYLKKFESNMIRMRGVSRISSTPEGQEKMLANRKISGTYKFQNGKEKTYTGSYELNALKFMDQVMNINPDDIMCPGPVLEYEYQGKRHFYITDFYYIPYNLIIEVKDGGKNPNRRNMPEYREKQIAKEKYIIKNTDFAYLRLTDNDLSQLLSVFMDLKMQLKDDTGKRVIHVNEDFEFILEKEDWKNQIRLKKNDYLLDVLEKFIQEATTTQVQLYFISTKKNIKSLSPRIPDNFFTRKGYEDNKTPRVCFSTDIGKCLIAISSRCPGQKYYVYQPVGEYKITSPTKKQVPDVDITDEKWICEKVEIECIGEILCIGDKGEDGIPYTYGPKNEYKAELYEWNWKWLKKYSSLNEFYLESKDASQLDKNFNKKSGGNFKFIDIKTNKSLVKKYLSNDKHYNETYKECFDSINREIVIDLDKKYAENLGYDLVESVIYERHLLNEPDIYYNKDKFDSGEINLCFITGHSGSGKSTMGRDMQDKDNIEHYELDDLNQNYKFTDENLKEYGDLIYSFFKGPGKKYRYYSYEDMQNCTNPLDDSGDEFDKCVNRDFINYAMKYSNSHKKSKFVLEGIWIYFFMKPEELKDYAVYIKGTSRIISAFRANKRDVSDEKNKVKRFIYSIKGTLQTITNKYSLEGERLIKKYREYFTKIDSVNEAMDALMTGYIPGFDSAGSIYIVNYMKNNVFSGDEERGYGVSNTPKLTSMFSRDKEGKLVKFPDNFLEECKYDVYMVKMSPEEVSNRIGKYIGEFVEEGFLYESIFGKKMYTYDQIMIEESAIPVIDFYKGIEMFSEVTKNLILQNTKSTENPIYFNENSQMVFDIGNNEDKACISYSTLRDGKVYVESVEYPELYLEADSINSIEAKFLQLLSSYRKEVK